MLAAQREEELKRMAENAHGYKIKNIWMLTREYEGLAGAGGVKDVVRQLAEAIARAGGKVSVVLPLYGFMDLNRLGFTPFNMAFEIDMPYVDMDRREYVRVFRQEVNVPGHGHLKKTAGQIIIYLLDAQRFLEKKSVYTYTAEEEALNSFHRQGSGHYDYFAMNILLQKASLALMMQLGERPDIIHCHDGHTALLPAIIRETEGYQHFFKDSGVVVTIHNAGLGYHQEVGDLPFAEKITGLPSSIIEENLLNGQFDPFLAASKYSVMNTVSENYARELRETDDDSLTGWLGHRLLARGVVLKGVTNGISPEAFDPGKPKALGLAAAFSPREGLLDGKKKCRETFIKMLAQGKISTVKQTGFLAPSSTNPLFTFVGRLSTQKGVDKLLGSLESLLPLDQQFQIVIMGSGTRDIETALVKLATSDRNRGRVCLLLGYDQKVANQVYAAGDFFLIPSQYEPCGLTDYIAQLFGNLPIVHHVGGLVKVKEGITGFTYREHNTAALMGAMERALSIFRSFPHQITTMQKAAVENIYSNYTWDMVLNRYLSLYQDALKQIQ